MKRLFALLLAGCLVLCGCHGSREQNAFAVPDTFDEGREYEITFWAKNDTNKTQTQIYQDAIAAFEKLYPNISVNMRLYTDYGKIYNDVITNIPTDTTPNVCITYPDHIATYLTGANVVVPLDELIEVTDHALQNGYTVCWDGDVSEKGFSFKNGVAINPEVKKVDDYSTTDRARFEKMDEKERLEEVYKFEKPFPEVKVTPEIRQEGYEAFVTTDDHLMHLTGIAKDQNGTKYYITKNSWGTERNTFGGYLNMSESFVRAKTIYIMIHKDALPKALRAKLGVK